MNPEPEPLLTCKQLAGIMGRNVRYVYDAKRMGFRMVGGVATFRSFEAFLVRNPPPSRLRNSLLRSHK